MTKFQTRSLLRGGLFLLALLFLPSAFSVNYFTRSTANWTANNTWSTASCGGAGSGGASPGSTNTADTATICPGNTITLNANPAFPIASLTFNGGATASNLTITGRTLVVTGAVTMNAPTTAAITSTLTVGTGTLTNTGGSISILGSATVNSTASITVTSGTVTTGSVTITGGASATGVASMSVTTGTITSSGAITLNGTAANAQLTSTGASTINVAGDFSNGGALTHTLGTFIFNGAAAQAITGTSTSSFHNLTVSNVTTAVSVTPTTNLMNVTTTLTMNGANTVLTPNAAVVINTVAAAGTITGTGTVQVTRTAATADYSSQYKFTTNTLTNLTVEYVGASAQIISNLIYGNLKMSNASGATLVGAATTVNGLLTFTSGNIVTGANSLILGTAATIATPSASSYVVGSLQKNYAAAANLSYSAGNDFPVGDATNFTPLNISAGTTTTAGSLTVSTLTPDHPQIVTPIASTVIDVARSVNRYWRVNSNTITVGTALTATFTFVAADRDNAADTPNYIVQRYDGTNWNPTTAGAANALDTTASNITPLAAGNNDFAIGAPLSGVTAPPGRYNVFETLTGAGSIQGFIKTKVSGTAFGLDVVNINAAKTAVQATAITVEVALLDSSSGGTPDVNGCNAGWPVIQSPPNFAIPASGRGTLPNITQPNSYPSVRFRIRSPVGGPFTQIGCSTDLFAIRPASITVSASDADWATAGVTRALTNTTATGGNVHKAGQPFTIVVVAQPTTATNYAGTPTIKVDSFGNRNPCNSTLSPSCTNGTLTLGTFSGAGTITSNTANYSEVGAFTLDLEDQTFANVDVVDGSTTSQRFITQTTPTLAVGRFVPDHFVVTPKAGNTPTFRTFNVADAACTVGSPTRSFTYIGQPFGYSTAPVATITAQNAANATTANYSGTLWKVGGTATSANACTTSPDLCVFTTSFTGSGNSSSVVESYAYILNPASTPNWDNTSAATAAATVTPGTGVNGISVGTGTIAISSSDTLAFFRSITTPQALFTANITDTISVQDASEVGSPVITGNGTIMTSVSPTFSNIVFDAGNEFRYGRLKLSNANGSELLPLPVPMQVQYWNGTASEFVTNAADNCTTLATNNFLITPVSGASAGVSVMLGNGGKFSSGSGSLTLSKPTNAANAKVAVDVCADLGSDLGGGRACVATTPAALSYLQSLWAVPPGTSYQNDPFARATFGVYKGANEFIYLRENY